MFNILYLKVDMKCHKNMISVSRKQHVYNCQTFTEAKEIPSAEWDSLKK